MIHGSERSRRSRDEQFWLTEEQFAKIEPHLADRHARQGTGGRPAGDQRHRACPDFERPLCVEPPIRRERAQRRSDPSDGRRRAFGSTCRDARAGRRSAELTSSSSPPPSKPTARRRAEFGRTIRRWGAPRRAYDQDPRADRRVLPASSRSCSPAAIVADCKAGAALIERLPDCEVLHADKGYNSDASAPPERRAQRVWPTSRPKPTAFGRTSSRRSSTAAATPSNACSAGSRLPALAARRDGAASAPPSAMTLNFVSYWL